MFCPSCGERIDDQSVFCVKCGRPIKGRGENASPKSRLVAILLCFFVGVLGIHRFYVGRVGSGLAIILTVGGFFGIWPFIDLIVLACGNFKDKKGRVLSSWEEA